MFESVLFNSIEDIIYVYVYDIKCKEMPGKILANIFIVGGRRVNLKPIKIIDFAVGTRIDKNIIDDPDIYVEMLNYIKNEERFKTDKSYIVAGKYDNLIKALNMLGLPELAGSQDDVNDILNTFYRSRYRSKYDKIIIYGGV